jgi:hypothetical protein
MGRNCTYIAAYLLIFYGIVDGTIVDVHLGNDGESHQMDRERRSIESERDLETVHNEEASPQERQEAMDRMMQNHEIA